MTAAARAKPAHEPVLTRAVVGITALNFLFFSAYLFFFPTLPFFIEKLGGKRSEIGLLIGVSSLTSMAARPFVGYLVDTWGRRPLIIGGLLLFSVNALLYNFTTSPAAVLPLRLLTGATMATFVTAASACIADVAPASRRGEVMAYYGMANSLAFAVGPALGGFIIHAAFLNGFDSALTSHARWISGARTGELHFATLFLVAAAITLAGAIAALRLRETRPAGGPARRLDPRYLFARSAAFPALVNFATSFVFAAIVSFLPLFARDHGVANPGNLFLVYAVFVILMRFTLGRWMDSAPRIVFVVPGILLLSGCMLMLTFATNAPTLYAAMVLYGAGAGTFQPAMMAHLVDRTPALERGRALSTFTLGNDLGLSLGSFVFGFIAESAGYRAGFAVAAVMATVGALLFAAGWQRERRGLAVTGPMREAAGG